MAATSYKIRGIEPPDLGQYDASTRKLFWSWVVDLGIKAKAKEILAGLDKDGKRLKPIAEETRKHRKSAMTPSGKGDPSAPPLVPGWQKSRTYSLLAGRALSTHAEFYWRYDPWTGESWGQILAYQAEKGRDVIGISIAATAKVKVQSWARWEQYKQGTLRTPAIVKARGAVAVPSYGRHTAQHVELGVSASGGSASGVTFLPGRSTGWSTPQERAAWRRQTASASLAGRPANPASRSPISGPKYNRLLQHVWGKPGGASPGGSGPKAPPKPKKPPAAPKPAKPKKLGDFEKDLKKAVHEAQHAAKSVPDWTVAQVNAARKAAIVATLEAHAVEGGTIATHGMTDAETFRKVRFWGIDWHFTGSVEESPLLDTVRQFELFGARGQLPHRLVDATKNVYFTHQSSKHDPHWRKVYKDFTYTHATGGDGSIVVYKNDPIRLSGFAHESGHNLAKEVYGKTDPTAKAASDYAAIVAAGVETPVSDYGQNSPSEDFAEAVRVYVQDRDKMKRDFPERFKVIHKIMSDSTYGG